jgi:hypothetical protein
MITKDFMKKCMFFSMISLSGMLYSFIYHVQNNSPDALEIIFHTFTTNVKKPANSISIPLKSSEIGNAGPMYQAPRGDNCLSKVVLKKNGREIPFIYRTAKKVCKAQGCYKELVDIKSADLKPGTPIFFKFTDVCRNAKVIISLDHNKNYIIEFH